LLSGLGGYTMKAGLKLAISLLIMAVCSAGVFGAEDGLVAWWNFDGQKAKVATDSIAHIDDAISGNFTYADGAAGKAGLFDGYTTYITRRPEAAPKLSETFTIEAWIAPQTYSWNWTAIVAQAGDVITEKPEQQELHLEPGLFGAKFNEPDFKNPDCTDTLEHVNQVWTGGNKDWSARWRGYIEGPFTGQVDFSAKADNGMKLQIDNKIVIDGWGRHKARSGSISMVKGRKYPIILSYFQDGDPSFLSLYWSWQGRPKTVVDASVLKHSRQDVTYVKTRDLAFRLQPKQRYQKVFFGLDSQGHISMTLMIDGQLKHCISEVTIPLLRWSHVAGTFDKTEGINLYINGRPVGSLEVKGVVTPPLGYNLLIGKSQKKMSPANTERSPSESIRSNMVFDGLIDEVKIYEQALSAEKIKQCCSAVKPARAKPLKWRVMPSGPKTPNPHFGAAYCRLRYDEQWEKLWRVGPDPDILVLFDESPVRVVFWRGTAYGAAWVTENGRWMGDQSLERTGGGSPWGCAEHMSDKQCRYSHVKLIENNDARVVVHWRYAVSDIKYIIFGSDKDGWGEWADEYYYIYPDAVSTRKQILHSNNLHHEWQETIALHQPGTRPEDNLELEALTWGNMDGRSQTFSWKTAVSRDRGKLNNPTIQITNIKAEYKPFIIFQPGSGLKLFTGCVEKQWSHFPWWNHWPVSQLPNDGRRTGVPDRPAHSSLSQSIEDSVIIKHDKQKGTFTAVSLYGMSPKLVKGLVPLARSWNYPAELKLAAGPFISKGYDRYQRAYVLTCSDNGSPSTVKFVLNASENSPVVNPAFVINGWGDAGAKLKLDGKKIKRGRNFRFGHEYRLQGGALIVWVKKEATEPITISLSPEGN